LERQAALAMARVKQYEAAAVNPSEFTDGVPDSDGSYTTIVRERTEVSVPAVAFASTGTLAVAGITVHPNSCNLYETATSIGGNASSSTIGWTAAAGAQYTNMTTNFLAYRMVAMSVRLYPTGNLSQMNGHVHVLRIPKGFVSATDTASCAPTTINAIANQLQTKSAPCNDPDQEGFWAFWAPTRVTPVGGAITSGSSFAWNNTGSIQGNNEGIAMLWTGTATAGAVNNDQGFRAVITAVYECQVPNTAYGLWGPAKVNNGSNDMLALALESLAAREAESSIMFSQAGPLIRQSFATTKRWAPFSPIASSDIDQATMLAARLKIASGELLKHLDKRTGVPDSLYSALVRLQTVLAALDGPPRVSSQEEEKTYGPVVLPPPIPAVPVIAPTADSESSSGDGYWPPGGSIRDWFGQPVH